ncbi:MAG: PAS domain-containing protein [Rubrivivax sp.]|nr:PAS domain-containing protein [Rubrivivax sp.]
MDHESARLTLLRDLGLLDTPPEQEYDDLVALAARLCATGFAVLTLVDEHRQWFKARLGLTAAETPRVGAFCAHAIESDRLFVVEDAGLDPRFVDHPWVSGEPGVRFYAGMPLVMAGGERIGTIAVLDTRPRRIEADTAAALRATARLAVRVIELHHERRQHADTARRLAEAQAVGQMGSWELDIASRELRWSDEVYRIFGLAGGSPRRTFDDFLRQMHPEDREGFLTAQAAAEAGLASLDRHHRIVRPDGEVRHLHERARHVPAGGQLPPRLLGTVRDVTDEVLARRDLEARTAELLRASARLRQASRLGRLGAWELDVRDGRLWWDEEVYRIFGLAPGTPVDAEQAIARFAPTAQPVIRAALQACARDGTPYDLVLQAHRVDGEPLWSRATAEAVRGAAGRVTLVRGAFQDISEQVRATEASHRIGRQLSATLEGMSEGFCLLDRECRVLYLNAKAERVLGRARDSVVGRWLWEVQPGFADTALRQAFEAALASGRPGHLSHFAPADRRWYEVTVHPSEDGLAVYFQDVTEQRALNEQLQLLHKLDSLGKLTGGVAHDFNNLLTVIIGNAEQLLKTLPSGATEHRLAQTIGIAGERGAEMTRRLLAFARRQPLEPRAVDFNQRVAGLDELLRRTLGEHIAIRLVLASGLWPALVDPGQLEVALLNLVINARDAMPRGGTITIATANAALDEAYAARHAEVQPGSYVMLAVSDTGCGIRPELLGRVFEPFFTTKEKGRGTGLGLATVYGFVKQSGGHVTLYSEPDRGTTVRLYLPRIAGGPVPDDGPAGDEPVHAGRGELVLLVEDDPLVRSFARGLLDDLGYRVLEAHDGPSALQTLRRHPGVDLLFTDVVMPGGMSGRDLADAVHAEQPGLPVLFASGYTEDVMVHHGRLDAGVLLLSKPYRRTELARKLRQALDGLPEPGHRTWT